MKRLLCVLAISLLSSIAHAVTPFELPWINQGTRNAVYRSSDHANAVFVLELVSSSCSACNQNAPNVNNLQRKYAHNPLVQILDVSIDPNEREITRWLTRHRPNHPVLHDKKLTLHRKLGVRYVPTVVILDCHGKERYRQSAVWTAEDRHDIEAKIDQILAEGCRS